MHGAHGLRPTAIAAAVGCCVRSARDAIRAPQADGLARPRAKPSRPKATGAVPDDAGRRRPREMPHRGRRDLGEPTPLWTPGPAAEVAHARGPIPRRVGGETIRRSLRRLG